MMEMLDSDFLKDQPRELLKIFKTLFSQGKSVRSKLIYSVGSSLHLDQDSLLFLYRIVEYIHNSSLLHDDVLDRSVCRRNHEAIWLKFSPEQAILAGDYLLAQVNVYLAQRGSSDLLNLVSKSIKDLVAGEFLQRELIHTQNEDLKKIDKVSDLKTSSLFKLCLISPFLLAHKERNKELESSLNSIGYNLGLLFQRSDDLLDFSIRNEENKSVLVDLGQNYLNSFSCFLLSDKSKKIKNQFRKMKHLKDIHNLIVDFEDKLKDFDKLNQNLIDETEGQIQDLESILAPEEQILIKKLKEIPKFFYYRKILK